MIELLKACFDPNKCEATAYPYWIIIDPSRVPMASYHTRVHLIASSITGPFFSRETAEEELRMASHHFSKHAVVYCASGYSSQDWKKLITEAKGEHTCKHS